MIEAAFKAMGRALRQAFRREGGAALPSTKDVMSLVLSIAALPIWLRLWRL